MGNPYYEGKCSAAGNAWPSARLAITLVDYRKGATHPTVTSLRLGNFAVHVGDSVPAVDILGNPLGSFEVTDVTAVQKNLPNWCACACGGACAACGELSGAAGGTHPAPAAARVAHAYAGRRDGVPVRAGNRGRRARAHPQGRARTSIRSRPSPAAAWARAAARPATPWSNRCSARRASPSERGANTDRPIFVEVPFSVFAKEGNNGNTYTSWSSAQVGGRARRVALAWRG
jgi:hypothetical protein